MMELGSVYDFLKGKAILVTGATGFLAKIFVEKILRVQPNIKKLYLLLRAENPHLATQRLHNEVFAKDLFSIQRDKWGEDFGSFVSEKVIAVAGDVSVENLGLKDLNLREEMLEEIDIIVHSAATTNFDERLDIAMGVNTMGALHVLNFAKTCFKVEILLHVSTAYVCGEVKGLIREEPLHIGHTLNGSSRLDINLEKQLIEEKLNELRLQNASEQTITSVMKNFGILRANLHGFPNAYVFTKAMGEMVLLNMKDDVPLIITRPTMVISTHSEPFPGWIEGVRTLDVVFVKYGKGTLRSFLGHPKTILDAIPADMVINSMIIALVAHSKRHSKTLIYHIGSSLRNPFRISDLEDIAHQYFTKNPLVDKYGKPVTVPKKIMWISSMSYFNRYIKIRYVLPLMGLNVVNKVFWNCYGDVYNESQRKIKTLMNIARFYKPYLLLEVIFDDKNAEKLRMATKPVADETHGTFNFEPRSINWIDYMLNTHLPGLIKYSVK
ncbi:alcohol-forming fatty acyl-CoA reductase-like [Gastrolobium bilobum]|uniref:alcohol-forming fatty acyl-CoA reductase-like n=1 Tax=Gastrolobium bilobum TaxID=150636 RepID=UPI002AB30A28|nr:alcohol-forming fatty acyl-CoA reductase-like [Gastrolobium bilobum]